MSAPREKRLTYVERNVDVALECALGETRCVGIFEPSRRGKTHCVENLQNKGYRYYCVANGLLHSMTASINKQLNPDVTTMTIPCTSWDQFIRITTTESRKLYNACITALNNDDEETTSGVEEGECVKATRPSVIHLDELQAEYPVGTNFTAIKKEGPYYDCNYPPAAALMCLIHHFNIFVSCDNNMHLVFSGVDVRAASAVNILSNNKYTAVHIPPIDVDFAMKVLEANGVVGATKEQLGFLENGSVGQLFSIIVKKADDGSMRLTAAYSHWRSNLLKRYGMDSDTAFAILCLLSTGTFNQETNLYEWNNESLENIPWLDTHSLGHSAWLRIESDSFPLAIEPPSEWHSSAFGSVLMQKSKVLVDAFHTMNAAKNAPDTQKGFIFQLLFTMELFGGSASPLFAKLGAKGCSFMNVVRFNKDIAWKPGTLYVVQESSEAKLGDIVFFDGDGILFVLELKQSADKYYLGKGLKKFARTAKNFIAREKRKMEKISTKEINSTTEKDEEGDGSLADTDSDDDDDDAVSGEAFRFRYVVSATLTDFPSSTSGHATSVIHDIASTPGLTVNLQAATYQDQMDAPRFIREVAGIKNDRLSQFQLDRVQSMTIGSTTTTPKKPKRPRGDDDDEYYVIQHSPQGSTTGSTTGTPFPVSVRTADIAHLKDAIKVKAPSTVTCDAHQLIIYDPDGKEVTDVKQPLKVDDKPYLFKLP